MLFEKKLRIEKIFLANYKKWFFLVILFNQMFCETEHLCLTRWLFFQFKFFILNNRTKTFKSSGFFKLVNLIPINASRISSRMLAFIRLRNTKSRNCNIDNHLYEFNKAQKRHALQTIQLSGFTHCMKKSLEKYKKYMVKKGKSQDNAFYTF